MQPAHFADGGVFDQIYKPSNDGHAMLGRAAPAWKRPSMMPGFGLTLGFTLFYLA